MSDFSNQLWLLPKGATGAVKGRHEPPLVVSTTLPPDELPGPGVARIRTPAGMGSNELRHFWLNPRLRGGAGAAAGYERDLRESIAARRTMIPGGRA